MTEQEFLLAIKELGITLTKDQQTKLKIYAEELLEYNKHTNLTAIKTLEDVYLKHFYDSLTLTKLIDWSSNKNILDIGTGAGFPGLVLAIVYPFLSIDLLDSNHKKIDFLNYMIDKISLTNVHTIYDRAENYTKTNREKYDFITSRAVAELRILLEISFPALKINGSFLAMKSSLEEEKVRAEGAIIELKGKIKNEISFNLPHQSGKRTILEIQKCNPTPLIYPRSYPTILKKSLKKKNN